MRKIDILKQILDSQDKEIGWGKMPTKITKFINSETVSNLSLDCEHDFINFIFDETGEKFIGIVNWKE